MCRLAGIPVRPPGWNPPSYAPTRFFISTAFQPRVRLVIRILRMRVAQNQAFYGQVVGFLDIMKVSVFIVLEWKTFENADWSKLETQGKDLPNPTKLLWFISRSFAWFAEFLSCFCHLCRISAVFLATFLPGSPSPKFDHFRRIRDARAAAAAASNMISWFVKPLSSSS